MLLYFLITCFCSILFFKSLLSLKPLPPWACELRFLSFWLWQNLSSLFSTKTKSKTKFVKLMALTFPKLKELEYVNTSAAMSVLDLPELALELILEKLPPSGLCSMAGVCTSLRERCMSDHLWARHMNQKWGNLIGHAARRDWQLYIASRKDSAACKQNKETGFARLILSLVLPWTRSSNVDSAVNDHKNKQSNSPLPFDSIMSCYLSLESGKFWFPAQVYNRENGHVGFMLSCYDAELSYDACTDTFQARYPPHGRRAISIESGVSWDRLRAPPINTSSHELHVSDCLNDLRPGDHIEIQWRRNKEFPYGWWYGVVGHLESCDGNQNHCLCHNSDTVLLEFHQYTLGSRWRSTRINKKDHREEGNEVDGFYGGIRKLYNQDEISRWKKLWPTQTLE